LVGSTREEEMPQFVRVALSKIAAFVGSLLIDEHEGKS
jgi:hypothetical protein